MDIYSIILMYLASVVFGMVAGLIWRSIIPRNK